MSFSVQNEDKGLSMTRHYQWRMSRKSRCISLLILWCLSISAISSTTYSLLVFFCVLDFFCGYKSFTKSIWSSCLFFRFENPFVTLSEIADICFPWLMFLLSFFCHWFSRSTAEFSIWHADCVSICSATRFWMIWSGIYNPRGRSTDLLIFWIWFI